MTARERVLATIKGARRDWTPTLFTMHFPAEAQRGEAALSAHLRFFREAQGDIGKIMNENLLRSDTVVATPSDMAREHVNAASRRGIDTQVDMVKRIVDQVGGERMMLATIHGPMVSIHHMSGRRGFFVENLDFYRTCKEENPGAMVEALKYAADALCELVRRCVEEGGADGIYFAALGAEHSLFTPEEYDRIVRPFDEMVLQAGGGACKCKLLHICKKGVDVKRFLDYPADVFNWEMSGTNPRLEEALAFMPEDRAILGGFSNEGGPLIAGTREEIAEETRRILTLAKGRRWIMGAGCTLPTGIDTARLRAVVEACRAFG